MDQATRIKDWPSGAGEMARLIRAHDWAATSLGSSDAWSPEVRAVVALMLANPLVSSLAVGPDRVLLYNDDAARLYGDRHPGVLGRPLPETWPEAYAVVAPFYERAFTGEAVQVPAQPLDVTEVGGEVFDAILVPVRDVVGDVAAVHMTGFEVGARLRAEATLKANEERLRTLFDSIDQGFMEVEVILGADGRAVDWRYVVLNPAFERLTGMADIKGRLVSEVAPDLEPEWAERYTQVVSTGEPVRFEQEAAALGRWFEVRLSRMGGPESRRVAAVYDDVTERKRAEADVRENQERQAFLLRLSDALRAEPSAEAIADRALQMLSEQMRLDRCFVGIYRLAEDIGDFPHQVHDNRLPPLPAQVRLSDFPEALRIAFDRTLVVDDVVSLSDSDRASFDGLGMRALIAATLRKGENNPLWAIVAVSTSARVWTQGEVSLVEETAERTWAAVERARAEAARRDSEARLAAAFESVPVGLAVTDASGKVVTANPEYRRFLPTGVIPSRDPARVARWRGWDTAGRPLDPHDFPGARALRGERVVPGQEMIHTNDEGREVWTSVSAVPVRDAAGLVTGIATVISDIDAVKRSSDALRESEERLREFGEASSDVLWVRDAETLEWVYLTPAFETIYGLSRKEALSGDTFRNWVDLILPEDRDDAVREISRVLAGERVTFEYRVQRPRDGEVRWLRNTDFPIWGKNGQVERIGGVGHDVTEMKRAEQAVRTSELRFRSLTEGIPQLVWRAVDGGEWTWASPQWTAFTGQAEQASHGWGWLELLHPDDCEGVREAWERSKTTGLFEAEYRLLEAATGKYRWFQSRAAQVRNEDGELIEWLGASTDVQDLREMQDRLRVLVAELQHRTRNLMGVVRSTMTTTLKRHKSLDEFVPAYRDRLDALARVNGLLSRLSGDDRVPFDELIQAELGALGAVDASARGERVTLDGPKGVRLRSSTVQTFALALHELATNALKYGALKQPGAHLTVSWRRIRGKDGPRLRVEWTESGVAMPEPGSVPQGGGYGRELIERALPYQLKAETRYELGPDGVRCTISLPLSSLEERTHA